MMLPKQKLSKSLVILEKNDQPLMAVLRELGINFFNLMTIEMIKFYYYFNLIKED